MGLQLLRVHRACWARVHLCQQIDVRHLATLAYLLPCHRSHTHARPATLLEYYYNNAANGMVNLTTEEPEECRTGWTPSEAARDEERNSDRSSCLRDDRMQAQASDCSIDLNIDRDHREEAASDDHERERWDNTKRDRIGIGGIVAHACTHTHTLALLDVVLLHQLRDLLGRRVLGELVARDRDVVLVVEHEPRHRDVAAAELEFLVLVEVQLAELAHARVLGHAAVARALRQARRLSDDIRWRTARV